MNFDIANKSIVTPMEEQAEEVMDATAEDLMRFVRAGGAIDFQTWASLNEFSKDCLCQARYEWRVELVFMISKAVREKYGPEQIWAMLDGGEALKDKAADEATAVAAVKAAQNMESEADESVPSGATDTIQVGPSGLAGNE